MQKEGACFGLTVLDPRVQGRAAAGGVTVQSQEWRRHNPFPGLLSQDPYTAGYCGHALGLWAPWESINMRTPGIVLMD